MSQSTMNNISARWVLSLDAALENEEPSGKYKRWEDPIHSNRKSSGAGGNRLVDQNLQSSLEEDQEDRSSPISPRAVGTLL
jgi:hypothetical protein